MTSPVEINPIDPMNDGSNTVIAAIVGAMATALIAMYAFGVFDRQPTVAELSVDTPTSVAPTVRQTEPSEVSPAPAADPTAST